MEVIVRVHTPPEELGGEKARMPRRRGRRRGRRRQRHHLYIVLDDWSCGYSIRKVNLTAAVSGQAGDDVPDLPPAFFRLEATHGCAEYFTSAFGTRILAMNTRDPAGRRLLAGTFVPMLDVRTMSMTFGPGQEYPINPIYLSVGNKLFSLSESSLEMLVWEPTCPPPLGRSRGVEWSWERLPDPPFKVYAVASYAVHPDGRTFLVSTSKVDITVTKTEEATFSFDTEELLWKRLGKWSLPFAGRCHFDPQLDAFVGLSKDPDTLGRLCSCYALGSTTAWKLGKENLFSEDPAERHVGATLVYMGQRKFCLVQCVSIEDDNAQQELKDDQEFMEGGEGYERPSGHYVSIEDDYVHQELKDDQEFKEEDEEDMPPSGRSVSIEDDYVYQELIDDQEFKEEDEGYVPPRPPGRCLYRLTTFSLSHDMNGDLTTDKSRLVQYYKVPKATTQRFLAQDPVAFWM
ncbi:hypothetical protein VPH35_129761 [Triticum aestivum]